MHRILFCAWLLVGLPSLAQTPQRVVLDSPISAERASVYRAFLQDYNRDSRRPLNVSDRTAVLEIAEADFKGCLKGIALNPRELAQQKVHRIRREDLATSDATLVDASKQQAIIEENDPQKLMQKAIDEHDTSVTDDAVRESVEKAFSTGLMELSEVIFDKSHTYAVMSYSFTCGGLCGNGGLVVMKKTKTGWKRLGRNCMQWVS